MIDFNTATCFGGSSLHMPIWLSPPVTTQEMADLVQSMTHKRKLRVDYSMLLTPTGTGLYQAGEVVTGHDYTEKVDIWSTGMTMLYMICGADVARPQGRIMTHMSRKLLKSLTPECTDLLDEMLKPNPVARASALQCYTHRWFTCDIVRSKRRGRLQRLCDEKRSSSGSRSRRNTSNQMERSQSAPPCPTARLQLMWFESLAMRQTYVVKMKRGKATHQELIVSLSQNIIAYPGGASMEDENGQEITDLTDELRPLQPAEVPPAKPQWRPFSGSSEKLLAIKDDEPKAQENSTCTCCRRRSAKIATQSLTDVPDVVIDVAEGKSKSDPIVPAPAEHSALQRKGSRELPRLHADRKSSLNDDKISRVSDAESGKTKNSKNSRVSRNTQRSGDSKKYIQTCSWMFRDETDSFAIRLPDGATAAPVTLNLSDIAGGKTGPFADQEEAAELDARNGGKSFGSNRDVGNRSEASVSIAGGSGTTGSRTALSQAATNLIKGNLKDLFNMIWSARGFRRKYSRECPF
jgi:serine/threonine protein kinase